MHAMKALVGIDGSPASYSAVQFAGRLLSSDRDEIIFFYSPPRNSRPAAALENPTLDATLSKLSHAVFDRARQQLPSGFRVAAQTIVSPRDPREGLQLAASDRRCDLLVVGAKGAGPLQQTLLGSVARHLADHATIPLLIVRSVGSGSARPLRVLLACDGTPTSRCASNVLERFSWPADSIGFAITVIEPSAPQQLPEWLKEQLDESQLAALGMGTFASDPQQEARRRREAAKWYGKLPKIFADEAPLVVSGHAGEQILAAIDAHDIDLVVVAARRRGPIRRLLLGSTSSYVVNHAPCSVLIVRGVRGAQPLRIGSSTEVTIS
jgi:nucleotide-binding universal stress UspA family protein